MKKSLAILFVLILVSGCAHQKKNVVSNVRGNLSDSALLDTIERRTFDFFWSGAEPASGMAPERIHMDGDYPDHDQRIIATGGSGFGVMAILAGIHRGYISRAQGLQRFEKIISFLEKADRFHGAYPHWINGENGHVKPFGKKDNGGDLVESSYLFQGLLCVRQFFKDGNEQEKKLASRIDKLWREIDYDWYRNGGQNVLYWHWSPEYAWQMNFPVRGYNECLILYILGASSPTHGVPAEVYHQGWAENGAINKISFYKNDTLHLHMQGDPPHGGPLFWSQYSFLGLDPRSLMDRYADYWKEMSTMSRINYQWCVDNPKNFKGYSDSSWGLTASYSVRFYAAHAPDEKNDLGVISPTAAISSFPYTPRESMAAIKQWYTNYSFRTQILGKYGYYDAFSKTENWCKPWYLSIDQGPEVVMIENYRSGLLWKLFMSCPEVQNGLKKLGFTSPWLKENK